MRGRWHEGTDFERQCYGRVTEALSSRDFPANVVKNQDDCLAIAIAGRGMPRLLLTDYWGPLALPKAEQVGWTLAVDGGDVIDAIEHPTVEVALRLVTRTAERHRRFLLAA